MFHGATNRHFVVNSVTKTGRSLNLAKGQWAIVDAQAEPTNEGLKITDDFDGLSKKSKVQIFSGSPDLQPNRSYGNKSNRSLPFKLSDIQEIRVSAPKEGIKVDHQVLGYDGFDDATGISLVANDDQEISLTLSGPALGILGYKDAAVQITERLTSPDAVKSTAITPAAGEWTDQQVVEEAVERLNRTIVMGSIQLSDYVEITPVNSLGAAATGTDQVFYNLTVKDSGTYSDLGAVQGQYPALSIKRTETLGDGSVYTAIAGSLPTAYTVNEAWLVKGCATCPAGYTELDDGFVYSIQIEDDGADSTVAILAISVNTTAGTAVQVNQEGGVSTYTVVTTAALSDAEKDAFITTNPEAIIELVAPDVAELCSPDSLTTIAWAAGDTCKVKTEAYSVIVGHDECDVAPTAAIQAAYPELTIVADSTANCSTKYTTTVTTNVVCEQCSDQFRGLFTSQAPKDYGVHAWQKDAKTYNGTAKMGISFKAKPFVFAGSEEYRDYVPSLATSTRIQIAGGYVVDVNNSFTSGGPTGNDFKVTVLTVASEPENWGLNLRNWEESSRIAFDGDCRFYHNNYGNLVTGKETNLSAVQPYVDYVIKVRTSTTEQGVPGERELVDIHDYHMLVAPGVHKDVEDVLNALALQAGVTPVQAFGTR